MTVIRALADRTVVLFLGVGVGIAIGYAFAGDIARQLNPPPPAPVIADLANPANPASPTSMPAAQVPSQPGQPVKSATTFSSAEHSTNFSNHLIDSIKAGEKIRVGVFGDSFGDGLWAGLYHQLHSKDGFEVLKFSQQATGFTRYKQLNLLDRAAEMLADKPIDIAVISFGANDVQPVMHNGHYAALMSPAWQEDIAAKITDYVALLRRHGAIVYWVGLPKMRKDSFDSDIASMNAFYAAVMARLGVAFIDTRPLSVDQTGAYAAYLPDAVTHEQRLMRANDGIHMSMHGYEVLTAGLSQRIRAYVDNARVAVREGRANSIQVAAQGTGPLIAPPPPRLAPAPTPAKASKAKDKNGADAANAPDQSGVGTSLDDIAATINSAQSNEAATPARRKKSRDENRGDDNAPTSILPESMSH